MGNPLDAIIRFNNGVNFEPTGPPGYLDAHSKDYPSVN